MSTLTIILIAIAIVIIAIAILIYTRKHRTTQLRGKFGTEYDRLVEKQGNRRLAEEELVKREKRVEKYHLRDLTQAEIDRFASSWNAIQTQFVDAPRQAVSAADRLVRDVMTVRGYPMSDFEQCAADISVDHPNVVSNYRTAHDLATRDATGKATTEDLRLAMVHYRSLFDELLGTGVEQRREHPAEVIR